MCSNFLVRDCALKPKVIKYGRDIKNIQITLDFILLFFLKVTKILTRSYVLTANVNPLVIGLLVGKLLWNKE